MESSARQHRKTGRFSLPYNSIYDSVACVGENLIVGVRTRCGRRSHNEKTFFSPDHKRRHHQRHQYTFNSVCLIFNKLYLHKFLTTNHVPTPLLVKTSLKY